MKKHILFLALCYTVLNINAQSVTTGNDLIDDAFGLAIQTIDMNTKNGLLEAGAGYGGEWTRDAAMNAWNCVSLLRPAVAEASLWSVTENKQRIGHQYWDKIIWTIGAWNHYLVTGEEDFLQQAYPCIRTTMQELEHDVFDTNYKLFMGPAVYQDGIEAYDEPIYDPAKSDQGSVLMHNSDSIKCLSTNILYYQCYRLLAQMAQKLEPSRVAEYTQKADALKKRIREVYYKPGDHKLVYLIDHLGHEHNYQEGIGYAFAGLFGILSPSETKIMLSQAEISPHGITAIYPSLPRNTKDKPGRHNVMVWPHVNMYYAAACAQNDVTDRFYFEMENVADLAINKGKRNFYEIYTIDGIPSGGYQCGHEWDVKEHQTWCATSYIGNIINYIFGLKFQENGIKFAPMGWPQSTKLQLKGIRYRNMTLEINIKGNGPAIVDFKINGKSQSSPFVPGTLSGKVKVDITM